MDPLEYAKRVRHSRMFIRFCCRLYKQQMQLGGRAILEHPKGSRLWTYPEVNELLEEHKLLTCHMCRYGLRVPGSPNLIRKATHLLVSHHDMSCLAKECPRFQSPETCLSPGHCRK